MKLVFKLGAALCFIFAFLVSCTNNSTDIAGNGTRIGNPTITGMIYKPDGKTPASNAQVYLRKKSSLPDIGLKKLRTDVALVTTNASGEFEIDSVEAGTYVIECSDNSENLALYDSVVVESPDSAVNLPADTLKPAGAIRGTIVLPEGGDFGRVYVLVFGVQRFAIVDDNGHFNLENLAEGTYNLRIISSLIHYESLDTTNIPVVSGDTTALSVEMLYNGLSVVKNVAIKHYDTLSRVVTLSWDKIESDLVHGYNVYRKEKYVHSYNLMNGLKNAELDTVKVFSKVNKYSIKDTVFYDSNTIQNQVYTYLVTAVGVDTLESTPSNEVSVTITTPFSTDTLIEKDFGEFRELKGNNPHKFLYENGMFYIVADNQVRIYDTLFNQTGVLSNLPARPFEIAADNSGRVYVSIANFSHDEVPKNITSIYIYSQNVFSGRINLTDTLDSIPALGIETTLFTISDNGNIIFVKNTKDSIYICDSTGSVLRKVGGFSIETSGGANPIIYAGIATITTDKNNNIYVYELGKGIRSFDADGVQIQVSEILRIQPAINFTVASNGDFYFVSGGLTVYSPEGQIKTRLNLPVGETHHIILTGNKMYALSGSNPTNQASVIKLTNGLSGR